MSAKILGSTPFFAPVLAATADVHAPAADTAAVVTYSAASGQKHIISGIAWSYNGAPTGGNLKIEDGSGVTVFDMDITSAGAGIIEFPFPKAGSVNTAMIITLAAGGGTVVGTLSVLNHWKE